MHLFHLARHPTRAIRLGLAAFLLALGLNAFAHAGHQHDPDMAAGTNTAALHATACGYCATFGALVDAPKATPLSFAEHTLIFQPTAFASAALALRTATSANPRAPPRK